MECPEVTSFRKYLRISTVQPNPNYNEAIEWIRAQAIELKAQFSVVECVIGKPIAIITINGSNPQLSSLLLNSHTDVVPVFLDYWKYDPFGAHKDECGNIYARGSQDMKCVAVQYIEALKRLKSKGVELLRTVHVTFVPDEEIGGIDGMRKFVESDHFKKLKVAFALDEGYASEDDSFFVFYGERNIWQFYVECLGSPGHGSQFLKNTAGEKLRKIIDQFMDFRSTEEKKLCSKSNGEVYLGDVTTVNLTMLNIKFNQGLLEYMDCQLRKMGKIIGGTAPVFEMVKKGGVQFNVVPNKLSVGFDVRVAPTVDLNEFESMINEWCKNAGDDVTINFSNKNMDQSVTRLDDSNVWWKTFKSACDSENIQLKKRIFPAGTDARYLRKVGIAALGFSPMNNTPLLLHDHNEFLNEKVFLRGIDIYETIIEKLGNLQSQF